MTVNLGMSSMHGTWRWRRRTTRSRKSHPPSPHRWWRRWRYTGESYSSAATVVYRPPPAPHYSGSSHHPVPVVYSLPSAERRTPHIASTLISTWFTTPPLHYWYWRTSSPHEWSPKRSAPHRWDHSMMCWRRAAPSASSQIGRRSNSRHHGASSARWRRDSSRKNIWRKIAMCRASISNRRSPLRWLLMGL